MSITITAPVMFACICVLIVTMQVFALIIRGLRMRIAKHEAVKAFILSEAPGIESRHGVEYRGWSMDVSPDGESVRVCKWTDEPGIWEEVYRC